MFRPRIIPVLLLKNKGLVKSVRFKNYKYIGDPINAVRLFNDFKADELTFLDIEATKEKRLISIDFIKKVGEEANMPFAVGGGVRKLIDIEKIIKSGAEKVIINTMAIENSDFIKHASDEFGSSTIVVCIDVKKTFFGKEKICSNAGSRFGNYSPEEFAMLIEDKGAGEIVIQSIDNDGLMNGYDIDLIKRVSAKVSIPIVALGGAGKIEHLKEAYNNGFANGLGAGSLFVYQGKARGVLINYPDINEKMLI